MENLDLSNLSICDTVEHEIKTAVSNFPSDVRKWMKANATPKMALKLMQICKYFQHQQFPYFVVKNFYVMRDCVEYSDLNNAVDGWNIFFEDVPNCLWITNEIFVGFQGGINVLSQIIPKIVVNEAKRLVFSAENISFDDFKALTSSGTIKFFTCYHSYIRHETGENVPLEDILARLPNIVEIYFYQSAPSFSSKEAAKKQWIPPNLKRVELEKVFSFDAQTFIEFMKEHKSIKFVLRFLDLYIFKYAKELQAFVDEIIQAADLRYHPPTIRFPHQTTESVNALSALEKAFNEK